MLNRKVEIITTAAGDQLIPPSPEENQAINEQIAADPEDVELDKAWFKRAKPTSELFPEAHEQAVRRKAALQAGLIENVSITLDRGTIDWYKAQTGEDGETGGTAWVSLVEEAVKFYALVAIPVGESAVTTGPGAGPIHFFPFARQEDIARLVPHVQEILRLVAPSEMPEHHEQPRTLDR